jgi:hypothetical protein
VGHSASERDWRSLARGLPDGGHVFLPGDRGYARTRPISNQRYARVLPSGVAACQGAGDIAAAVAWARDRDMPFALRSGGHSYAGYSTTTGLLIDLSGLDDISVDPAAGQVTAGTGVTQAQLHEALRRFGRTFPSGRCPTVAIGGLVLGGGIGFASRKLGLACDSLVRTDLLTASGEVLTCSALSHGDLFWACRGGAGGSFGVNTSFTLRTQAVTPVTLFELSWPLREARNVLAAVQEITRQAPDEFGIRADIATRGSCQEEAAKRARVAVIGQFLGPRRELERVLTPILRPGLETHCRIRECGYWEAVESFADQPPVYEFAVRSRMVTGTLPDEAVGILAAEITRWPGSQNEDGACAALFALGGAVARVAPDATAFVHRDAAFILALETNWTGSDPPSVTQANLGWLDRLYAQLAPYTEDSAYQNFPDPELKNWQIAYYGSNYDRLAAVKRTYDPENVFKFEQSIR